MIFRNSFFQTTLEGLQRSPIVALLGPRQVGKTTLAKEIARQQGGEFFDLEKPSDLARLQLPEKTLAPLQGLVVIDEIQYRPDLFPILRVLADRTPQQATFLILGSAAPELLRHTAESLAGRVEIHEMSGFQLEEVGLEQLNSLWSRGGFPKSWLAKNDKGSLIWRENFIKTFLERDIASFGIETSPKALGRIWEMLAHYHGCIWNASEFGRSLGESYKTVRRHLDILSGVFMIRELPPWFENRGKRIVRSPKVYLRDSGLLHALLQIPNYRALQGHPKCGASWEGFCLEQIITKIGDRNIYFWRTHAGAELDLLFLRNGKKYGVEVKYSETPKPTKSMHIALEDLELESLTVIYPGEHTIPLGEKIMAQPLEVYLHELGYNE